MKMKVLGVHSFPQSDCFKVVWENTGKPIDTAKMKVYGINPREAFCRDTSLLGTFTGAIGKEVDVSFDFSRNIVGVKA